MSFNTISNILETITALGFFAAIILSFYFYLRFRNKERMALIEKGVDVSEIFKSRDITFKFPWLRLGMLILGIGFGLCVGYLISVLAPTLMNQNIRGSMQLILMSSLLIFGGLGIIIGNILERSGNKKNG